MDDEPHDAVRAARLATATDAGTPADSSLPARWPAASLPER